MSRMGDTENEKQTPTDAAMRQKPAGMTGFAGQQGRAMRCVGVDEVGRGAWAGPLVAAAVVLDRVPEGLKDSKLLTKKARERLAREIRACAKSIGIGWVGAAELDRVGVSGSLSIAMRRAVDSLSCGYGEIIIDGTINFLPEYPVQTLAKADNLIAEVSAASIIAKVARDNFMHHIDELFPNYGFAAHVGYGTKRHLQAITDFGVTILHRRSYKPVSLMV